MSLADAAAAAFLAAVAVWAVSEHLRAAAAVLGRLLAGPPVPAPPRLPVRLEGHGSMILKEELRARAAARARQTRREETSRHD